MNCIYDEEYYERGTITGKSGYSNYRWIPELTLPMCSRLIEKLSIKDDETILDFGCAKGFIVKAFRMLGKQAWGVDISDYAINNADDNIKKYLYKDTIILQQGKKYNWTIAKDVLEHISYEEINNTIQKIQKSSDNLFCCIPLGENNSYYVSSYNLDVTHIIKETLEWWNKKFCENGFDVIYSDYFFDIIKNNYSIFEKGNGFFILKSKD